MKALRKGTQGVRNPEIPSEAKALVSRPKHLTAIYF
jgi:hypothetical protein